MSAPVGLTIPKLLPITGTFTLPFAAYYTLLQTRVVLQRLKTEKFIETQSSTSPSSDQQDPLLACRVAQTNFSENVPLALVLAGIVELNGGSRKALTGALSALLVFRLLHAELGIMQAKYMGNGRPAGYFGTQGVVLGLAGYCVYLVKGYWGL